jgi:hypothetical protein
VGAVITKNREANSAAAAAVSVFEVDVILFPLLLLKAGIAHKRFPGRVSALRFVLRELSAGSCFAIVAICIAAMSMRLPFTILSQQAPANGASCCAFEVARK